MLTAKPLQFPKLAVLLERRREQITSTWLDRVRELPNSHYQQIPADNLRASIQQAVGAIIEWFAIGSEHGIEMYLSTVSAERLAMGFDIGEVIEALLIWKELTLQIVRGSLLAGSETAQAIEQVDDCLRYMITRFSHLYAEATQKQIREQQIRTALMYHVVQIASGSLDLEEVLQRVAHGIVNSVGVQYCALYLMDAKESALIPRVVMGELSTSQTAAFFGRWLDPNADTLIAELLARHEPIVSQNVETDPRFSHETAQALGVPTLLAVPCRSGEHVLGAVFVSPFGERLTFDQSEINLMRGIANAVAVVIDNARLSEQEEQLAVVNERQRLARELHDSVAQSLYSIMLYAEAANESLRSGHHATVGEHLGELKVTAQEALRDMRLLIFELRPADLEEKGLAAALRGRMEGVEARSGLQCNFCVEGEENLDAETADELYHIAREVLNNILHHARARTVRISLCFEEQLVCLRIEDDGVGFDPALAAQSGGMGLRGMRERVTRLGGTFELKTCMGYGTSIIVTCRPSQDARKVNADG